METLRGDGSMHPQNHTAEADTSDNWHYTQILCTSRVPWKGVILFPILPLDTGQHLRLHLAIVHVQSELVTYNTEMSSAGEERGSFGISELMCSRTHDCLIWNKRRLKLWILQPSITPEKPHTPGLYTFLDQVGLIQLHWGSTLFSLYCISLLIKLTKYSSVHSSCKDK